MRFVVAALTFALGAPAAAAILVHTAGIADAFGSFAAGLPDPATAALMFGVLGLVAGARRLRSNALAD